MAKPTKPTVPDPALRSQPDTFNDRVEANVSFWATLVQYMSDSNDYTEEQANAALAAAIAGDLPAISGNALRALRLNSGGTAAEFATIADLLNDGGVTLPAGELVGTTATQTMTNKTLAAPQINMGSDATGDLYYRTGGGAFARLPAGSNGQVLRMTGGVPTWGNAPGTWQQISRTVLAGETSLDITWTDGTYKDVRLKIMNLRPSADDINIYLRGRRDATWLTTAGQYEYLFEGYVVGAGTTEYDNNASGIALNDLAYQPGDAAGEGLEAEITVNGVSEDADVAAFVRYGVREDSNSARLSSATGFGLIKGTTSDPVTGLRLYPDSGNMASGIVIAEGLLA